jgi:hypothetical protein
MQEQMAVLAQDHGGWVFVTNDDLPERTWNGFKAAIRDLQMDGWRVAEGPGIFRPSTDEFISMEVVGYSLRRSVH